MNKLSFLFALTYIAATAILPIFGQSPAPTFTTGKVHILLVGDSTVTDGAGWGKGFAECLKDDTECINLSKGGRSSKSYIGEGSWKQALATKPDYVFIQFGHNDQKGHGPERETDPQTTYKQYMTQYVDDALAANIKPILVTSLSRRQWTRDGKINSGLAPYADVVKEIAAEKKIPVIDLHALSIALYESLGKDKMLELSPIKNADPKSQNSDTASVENKHYDGTHLNAKGSEVVGKIVADEVKKDVPDLSPHIK